MKFKSSITKYNFKIWNLGFLGVTTLAISAMLMQRIKSWWIGLIIVMIGWAICEYLIEKEVNNWLAKEAIVTIWKN